MKSRNVVTDGNEADVAIAHALGLASFLRPERRDRFRQLLRSAQGRTKLRASLAHFRDLDPEACAAIPPREQNPSGIEKLLADAGAPAVAYVISEDGEVDASEMPLHDALVAVVGRGSGTLISCIPGKLGYYEGEDRGERFILRHDAI